MHPLEELLGMTDEELGEVTRHAMTHLVGLDKLDELSTRTDLQRQLGSIACAHVLVRCAAETNAEETTYTIEGFQIANEPHGDWEISVRRTDTPAVTPTPEELGYEDGEDLIIAGSLTVDTSDESEEPHIHGSLTYKDGEGNERDEKFDTRGNL